MQTSAVKYPIQRAGFSLHRLSPKDPPIQTEPVMNDCPFFLDESTVRKEIKIIKEELNSVHGADEEAKNRETVIIRNRLNWSKHLSELDLSELFRTPSRHVLYAMEELCSPGFSFDS